MMGAVAAAPALERPPSSPPVPRRRAAPRPSARRRVPFLLASAVLVGALVVGVVSVQALVSQTSFKMDQLAGQTNQLHQQNDVLRLQVARLSAPTRIADEARRMGMVVADPAVVKTLRAPGGHRQQESAPPSFAARDLPGAGP